MGPETGLAAAADPAAPDLASYEIVHVRDPARAIVELATQGFAVPGREVPPVPFRLPFDWHADPLGDRNWMFNLQAWRMLDPYLVRLLREPEHPRGFADPMAVIADWRRDNLGARTGGGRRAGRFTWYDMATGLRALKLAFLGRLAAARGVDLGPLLPEIVARHMAELSRPEKLSQGNHGLFQMSGLKALAWQFPDVPGAAAAAAHALAHGTRLLDRQLGPQGVHTEDAPDYHFFAVALIGRLLAAPWWQVPEMAPFRARLAAARNAEPWLMDPVGRCLPVGDSTEARRPRDPAALRRWPHLKNGRMVGAVLDGYGVVRTRADVPPPRSTLVFFMASHHLEAHKHADCLSLLWQDRGEWLLLDSGKYGYERDRMRRYFLSTRAHNTVEAGRDWSRATADAYGAGMRRVEPLGAGWLLEAEADHRREGLRHRRLALFRPHRFLLVLDHLAPRPVAGWAVGGWPARLARLGPRRFTGWWHFAPGHTIENGRVTGLAGGRALAVSHVANGTGLERRAVRGQGGRRPQGWLSRSYGAFEPAPVLGFAARARGDYRAATLFELLEPGAAPALALAGAEGRFALAGAGDLATEARRLAAGPFALDIAPGLL